MQERILWDATFPQVSREQRPRYFAAMNATIARLHQIDFAALGLADFAHHLMMYRVPPRGVAGLLGANLQGPNIPTEAEYVAACCARTGRADIANLNFYRAFNLFRFTAILHDVKGRVLRGRAAAGNAREMSTTMPLYARSAWQAAQG